MHHKIKLLLLVALTLINAQNMERNEKKQYANKFASLREMRNSLYRSVRNSK